MEKTESWVKDNIPLYPSVAPLKVAEQIKWSRDIFVVKCAERRA
jgi:hypothetical protein